MLTPTSAECPLGALELVGDDLLLAGGGFWEDDASSDDAGEVIICLEPAPEPEMESEPEVISCVETPDETTIDDIIAALTALYASGAFVEPEPDHAPYGEWGDDGWDPIYYPDSSFAE